MRNALSSSLFHRFRNICVVAQLLRLVMMLALLCVGASWRSARGAQPIAEHRALSGRVTTDNNLPLGGATITLRLPSANGSRAFWGAVVTSDARGYFSVPDAEDGTYVVVIEAPGFAPQNQVFVLDESSSLLEIKIERLTTLTLRLLGVDGKLLVNSTLTLLLRGEDQNGRRMMRTRTNGEGIVSLTGLAPTTYGVNVVAPGHGYGSQNDIKLLPGNPVAPVDLRLQQGGTLRVTAREEVGEGQAAQATPAVGRALGGAVVSLSWPPSSPGDAARTTPFNSALFSGDGRSDLTTRYGDGTLELTDLAPGQYTISVTLPNVPSREDVLFKKSVSRTDTSVTRTVEIKAGETTTIDFTLKPSDADASAAIQMLVQNAKGEPLADTEFSLQLDPLQGNPAQREGVRFVRARSGADGRLSLYPLAVGEWRIAVGLPREVGIANAEMLVAGGRLPLQRHVQMSAPQIIKVEPQGASATFVLPPDITRR